MTRLEQFIDRLMTVADRRNIAPENPITIMIDVGNSQFFTVVSYSEPNHVTLPLNVTWVVADPDSPHYMKALRRASALPFDGYRNTWAELRTYEDFEEEPQFWDLSATFQFGEVQVTGVQPATETMRGIFALNSDPSDPSDPVVVSSDDPRMSNDRQPLPHTHPLMPSTMLQGSEGINEFYVEISDSKSPKSGEVLMLTNPGTEPNSWEGVWRYVESADLVYDGPTVTSMTINGPTDDKVDEGTPVPFTVDVSFSDGSTLSSVSAVWEVIANSAAGTIRTSTGVFTSNDVSGDQVVRIKATWRHDEANEEHSTTYDLTVVDNTVTAVLERIEIQGADTLTEGGNTETYSVRAHYDDGSSRGITPSSFTSSNSSAGTLNPSTGIFTTSVDVMNNQTTTLSASYTEAGVTKTASLDLTVEDTTVYPVSAVIVGPDTVSEGTEVKFALSVTFTDLSTSEVGVSDWATSNPAAGVIDSSSGMLTATPDLSTDEVTELSASYSSNGRTVSATKTVTVSDETVYPLSAEIKGPDQVDENTVATYSLEVTFSDSTKTVVVVDDWSISDSALGTIGANSGEFTAVSDVSTNLTATVSASYTQSGDTVTATKAVTVIDTTNYPVSANIVGSTTMGEGQLQVLVLEITYQDGTTEVRTASDWFSSNNSVATVNASGSVQAADNLTSSRGVIITAEYTEHGETVSANLSLTVTDDTNYPVSAVVKGPETINEGTSVDYRLEVTFQDGTKSEVPVTSFTLSDSALGTITSNGRFTAPSTVSVDVTGQVLADYTLDGTTVNGSLGITVTDTTVYPASALIIGPSNVDEETSTTYELEVTYTDTTKAVVAVSDWSSSDTSVGIIGASTGVLTTLTLSSDSALTVSATYTEEGVTVSDSKNVVVSDTTNYPVSAVVQGPAAVQEGAASTTYSLEVSFSDGKSQVMPATWSQSNSSAGTLDSSTGAFVPASNITGGDKTTRIEGSYTVAGTTVKASINVTVEDLTAYPTSATIVGPTSVDEEQTATYTLRVNFDDSTTETVAATDFASSNPAAGSIDPTTGVFTAATNDTGSNISTTISASWTVDGTTETGTLSVGVVDTTVYIASTEIEGPSPVDEDTTHTYSFKVNYDDGTSATVPVSDWAVDNTNVATIDSSGVLTVSDNITSNRTVTISASYTDPNGTTHGQTKTVNLNDTILRPVNLAINGPDTVLEGTPATYTTVVTYDNGSSSSVTVTDWAISPSTLGSFVGNEFTANAVDADEAGTVTCSYTENGTTVSGTKAVTVEHIYPTSALVSGPTTVGSDETHTYTLAVSRSDGSSVDEAATWSIAPQTDVDGNPVTIPATIDNSGLLTVSTVTEDLTITIEGSYTENGTTVSNTIDVALAVSVVSATAVPKWGFAGYVSPSFNQGFTGPQAFIDSLVNEMPDRESGNTITYQLAANEYAYYACPKDMGEPTFVDLASSFSGGWDGASWLDDFSNLDDKGPVEVMYDAGNGPEPWYIYRTDWPGPNGSPVNFRVDF